MPNNADLTFNISLTVLNSLGRNLYRDFITVIGEAVSNAWDADAVIVDIHIDRKNNEMIIRDDGVGMSLNDFAKKFLKIGYSKRKDGEATSKGGRPFIGRKGIGKLALLSCANRVTVVSKTAGGNVIGGTIDNGSLDAAIKDDLNQNEYHLEVLEQHDIDEANLGEHGTTIRFTGLKDGIANSIEYLRKSIALYFRFSLVDNGFKIVLNGKTIDFKDLEPLINNTEFIWNLNSCDDPLARMILLKAHSSKTITTKLKLSGFVASVKKPKDLKVLSENEKVGIDLFVNGRLRERNMLKHVQTARIPESYLYGQIHFNDLDDGSGKDRFTSSREGVIADDELFQKMLAELKGVIKKIIDEWDDFRLKAKEDGDEENPRKSKRDRASSKLFTETAKEYMSGKSPRAKDKVDKWIDALQNDAEFNFSSYAECFISENLLRQYIQDNKLKLTNSVQKAADRWRKIERENKEAANMEIQISQEDDDKNYIGMHELIMVVDPSGSKGTRPNKFNIDEAEYTPLRNAVMHTSRLSHDAKLKLTTVFNNIKAKVKRIISTS